MPHKRNPVKCEQICGLSRVLRGFAVCALENAPLWHERDISHSSAERVILPDATGLACYMLRSMTRIVNGMEVYPERMLNNVGLTRGLAYCGQLLLDVTRKGVAREEAYICLISTSILEGKREEGEKRDAGGERCGRHGAGSALPGRQRVFRRQEAR